MNFFRVEEYKSADFDDFEGCNSFDPERNIKDFISLYLRENNFKKILILRTTFLRNPKDYFHTLKSRARIISFLEEAVPLKESFYRSCFSHGHLSVLFFIEENSVVLNEFLNLKYFKENQNFNLIEKWNQMFCSKNEALEFIEIIQEYSFGMNISFLAFSHDADYMYRITQE